MKRTDTWMPLYIGDYLADTGHLNAQQHGAYLLMLMHQWRTGPLPDDDRRLCQIARVDLATWKRSVGPIVREFFTASDSGLSQKRLEHERKKSDERTDKRSAAGALGATNRWQVDGNANGNANGKHQKVGSQNDGPSPSPSSSQKEEPSLRSGSAAAQRRARATRLPNDWMPDEKDVSYAKEVGLDIKRITEDFRDYWHSASGRNSVKNDWKAAWRFWCRHETDKSSPASGSVGLRPRRSTDLEELARGLNLFGTDEPPIVNEQGELIQ